MPSTNPRDRSAHWVLFSCFAGGSLVRPVLERAAAQAGRSLRLLGPWRDWRDLGTVVRALASAERVFIWNGEEPGCDWAKRVCDAHGVPWCVVESGLFPQARHFHLDPCGIIGRSSLNGPLDWVTGEDIDRYRRHRDEHFRAKGIAYRGGGGYAMVPLQLDFDTAAYLFSPFKTMQALVEAAADLVPELPLVVCPHPIDPRPDVEHPRATLARPGSSLEVAVRAEVVIGANSTLLYETAALGAPTIALADGPMKRHHKDPERLLAAVVARQTRVDAEDLAPWIASAARWDGSPPGPVSAAPWPAVERNRIAPSPAAVGGTP